MLQLMSISMFHLYVFQASGPFSTGIGTWYVKEFQFFSILCALLSGQKLKEKVISWFGR